jgi:hypothetical protein
VSGWRLKFNLRQLATKLKFESIMIGDSAAEQYYVWTAAQALLPVALGAFVAGLLLAWLFWGIRGNKGGD